MARKKLPRMARPSPLLGYTQRLRNRFNAYRRRNRERRSRALPSYLVTPAYTNGLPHLIRMKPLTQGGENADPIEILQLITSLLLANIIGEIQTVRQWTESTIMNRVTGSLY